MNLIYFYKEISDRAVYLPFLAKVFRLFGWPKAHLINKHFENLVGFF